MALLEAALPVAAAAQRLQGHRHRRVESLEAPVPGDRTPDLAHVIPVDHECKTTGQTLGSTVSHNDAALLQIDHAHENGAAWIERQIQKPPLRVESPHALIKRMGDHAGATDAA